MYHILALLNALVKTFHDDISRIYAVSVLFHHILQKEKQRNDHCCAYQEAYDRVLRYGGDDKCKEADGCNSDRVRQLRGHMIDVLTLCAGARHDGRIGDR